VKRKRKKRGQGKPGKNIVAYKKKKDLCGRNGSPIRQKIDLSTEKKGVGSFPRGRQQATKTKAQRGKHNETKVVGESFGPVLKRKKENQKTAPAVSKKRKALGLRGPNLWGERGRIERKNNLFRLGMRRMGHS